MSSVEFLRDFINERLTAAAEEIFTVFQQTIVQYEEEIDQQRKLLQMIRKPQIKLRRAEFLQPHIGHHATSSSLEREEHEAPQIKEKDVVSFSRAVQTVSPVIPPYAVFPPHTVINGASSWASTPTADDPQRRRKKAPPELFKKETNFCPNQKEPEPLKIKEEPRHRECKENQDHQELGTIQEGDQLILKVENDSSMLPIEEQRHLSEPQEEPDTEQFFSHDSEVHDVNKHLDSESSVNAELEIINAFLSDGVNVIPVSEKRADGEKRLSEETFGGNVCKKNTFGHNVETVADKKKNVCAICGKSYTIPQNLVVHMRTHTGEKPYSCEMCGKSFCQQNGLLRHMRTHTGEKPYSCRTCGKSFSQRCNLLVHSRTHTGEKPYSCEKCVKRFTNRRSLLRHGKAHEMRS